jgi:hypothetical protein
MNVEKIDLETLSEIQKRYLEASLKKHGYMSIIDYDLQKSVLLLYNKSIKDNTQLKKEFLWIFLK